MPLFGEYEADAIAMITTQSRVFYPDYLEDAVALYSVIFERFGELISTVDDSANLLREIAVTPVPSIRNQLLRVFRKYVSPTTSVEMLKRVSHTEQTITDFGNSFRPIADVRAKFAARPVGDEALAAIFWEHHDRGTPGYEVSETFFTWFENKFADEYEIIGPRRSGADVQLRAEFPKFRDVVPADFVIFRKRNKAPLIVGFARYDSDRGGSQEDDRPGQNHDKARRILAYAARRRIPLKVLFVNDGPGLLLGTMWRDYASLETANIVDNEVRVMVTTLKMLDERVTKDWLES